MHQWQLYVSLTTPRTIIAQYQKPITKQEYQLFHKTSMAEGLINNEKNSRFVVSTVLKQVLLQKVYWQIIVHI
jgi:hypothetical protein